MNRDERLVGRLLMVGVPGPEPDDEFLAEIERWGAGGLIFFSRHLTSLDRFRRSLERILEVAPAPPLVAIDHEGGPVLRFGRGVSEPPSAMALAAAADPSAAGRAAAAAGAELRGLGFTVNLAPVADVNDPDNPGIGIRSFGPDPETVAAYVAAVVEGYARGGVLATAKHFPGKGGAMVDAHVAMPTVDASRELLERRELPPFRAAIAAGVGLVMTSHVLYPALDAVEPATFSRAVAQGLLRDDLGFDGVLVSDDLEMGGSKQHATPEAAALRCLVAGHDLALICHDGAAQARARRRILEALATGELPRERAETAAARVERAVARVQALPAGEPDGALLDDLTARAITRLPGGCCVPPLSEAPGGPTVYVPDLGALGPGVDDRGGAALTLVAELHRRLGPMRVRRFSPSGRPLGGWDGRVDHEGGPVLFLSLNAHLRPGQATLLRRVHGRCRGGLIHVALRNPFDLDLTGERPDVLRLATLGYRSNALRALARVLLDGAETPGRLP